MSFVRAVIAASSADGSMVKVAGSTSTKTGRAPFSKIASPVAMNVLATVTTSSPGPTPKASRARVRASVPLATPQACATPQYRANSSSSRRHSSPPMNCPPATTRATAPSISSRIRAYWALRSTMGTDTVAVSAMLYNPRSGNGARRANVRL
jgi:hypothetical protein